MKGTIRWFLWQISLASAFRVGQPQQLRWKWIKIGIVDVVYRSEPIFLPTASSKLKPSMICIPDPITLPLIPIQCSP